MVPKQVKKNDASTIGNGSYIGPGAKIFGNIKLGNNIAIGANAVINKDFKGNNISIGGIPAKKISDKGSIGLHYNSQNRMKILFFFVAKIIQSCYNQFKIRSIGCMKKAKKLFLFLFLFFICITTVNAETKNIEVTNVTVKEKSTTIEVAEPVISQNEITSNITFNELNDYVTFELTLKNNESEKYKITSIKDNNTNANLEIEYDYSDDFISSGEEAKVRVKLTYKKKLTNENISLNNLTITLTTENASGETSEIVLNPTTGDNILHFLVLLIIAITGLILIKAKKKKKIGALLVLAGLILIPFAVLANEKFEINFKFTNIEVKGEFESYNVTINKGDGTDPVVIPVKYGEKIGELPEAPEKTGHTFVGWIDEENREITEDTVITGPINITPVYSKNKYQLTITNPEYLDEGNISGQYEYGTQITLTAKQRDGFTFSKWSNDETSNPITITIGTSDITIEPIYIEDGQKTATFKTGQLVNTAIKKLAGDSNAWYHAENRNIEYFNKSEVAPDISSFTEANIISTDDSEVPIYAWWNNSSKTIYWWSEANIIYLNEDISYMFSHFKSLTNVSFSEMDSSNIVNMQGLFYVTPALTNVDFTNFNTSNVTNMAASFFGCGLETIDLSGFDTGNVENMRNMFTSAKYTELDVSSFNTIKVTDMSGMFSDIKNITELDISNFDTRNVYDMSSMFYGCTNLKTIYASDKFVVTSVNSSDYMFNNDTNLVGGTGTMYAPYNDDKEYANIDDGICDPGYFSRKYNALITFDPNGGTSSVESRYYDSSTTYNTLPRPYRKGYLFDGWYTEPDGGDKVLETDTPVDGLMLYAKWKESRDRDVQLADNGDGEVSKGDYVRIGDEEFYVAYVKESITYMLTKNYLDANYRQSEDNYVNIAFSDNDYWNNFGATSTSAHETIGDYYRIDSYGNPYVYEDPSDEEPNNNITEYIKNYEEHLRNDLEVKGLYQVTLPSYEDVKGTIICEENDYVCKEIFKGKDNGYWLGSVYNDGEEQRDEIFYIDDAVKKDLYSTERAIRPMVVINTNDIK